MDGVCPRIPGKLRPDVRILMTQPDRYEMDATRVTRRAWLAGALPAAALGLTVPHADEPGWGTVPSILANIRPPQFPRREFDIGRFGAKADGFTDATGAIGGAIEKCSAAGGGTVIVPPGRYLTGPLHLRSNVHLRVDEGATLLFSPERTRYLPCVFTRFEGVECMNWSPMIYALDQENIAITGRGTLDAQGAAWHAMNKESSASRRALLRMAADGVPVAKRVFGEGHKLRPNFVQFYRCRNLLIEGVTLRNSPMWSLHLVLSRNIVARGITIQTTGPNTDGIDPESCSDVLIEGCRFNTQDDGIAIKSGRNHDGRRIDIPSQNIVIRNCRFENIRRNLFAIGSEVSGGVRNVFVEKCQLSRGLRGIFIKSNSARGGILENLFFRDLEISDVRQPVVRIGMDYGGEKGTYPPVFRNFHFENIRAQRAGVPLEIVGLPESPVENVAFRRCDFQEITGPNRIQGARGLKFDRVTINGQEAAL